MSQMPPALEAEIAQLQANVDAQQKNIDDIKALYAPIDCELGPWEPVAGSETAWMPAVCPTSGQQARNVLWRRAIVTPPANGGAACGLQEETRVEYQACTPLPPPGPNLLSKGDLAYEGAFRAPAKLDNVRTMEYGGTALAYWPDHDSLLVTGHDQYQLVGEMTIPTPAQATSLAQLPRATWKQTPTDIFQGRLIAGCDGTPNQKVKVGGVTVVGDDLYAQCWNYYDGGGSKQTRSLFKCGTDFSALPPVADAVQVGRGFQDYDPSDMTRIAGFVSGYICPIPLEWRGPLGGTHLTGQGGGISVLGRTSSGPSATVFTPTDHGTPDAITNATLVMGYPISGNTNDPLYQPTMGIWGQNNGEYTGLDFFRGMVFPDGTRSILFFGRDGTSFCYGAGTKDPKLHLTPVYDANGNPTIQHYCYDPAGLGGTGPKGWPYRSQIWAYDVLDFIAVKEKKLKPWEVKPYKTWSFDMPFQAKIDANGTDCAEYALSGAAWDPKTRRIFLTGYANDGAAPLVHTLKVP